MDQGRDLLLRMKEMYLRAHSVIQYHNELASNVTNELATGSCIMERIKRPDSNGTELGMDIPTVGVKTGGSRVGGPKLCL